MSRIEIPATLYICVSTRTGEVFVLLDEAEITEELDVIRRDFQERAEADRIDWLSLHEQRIEDMAEIRAASGLEGESLRIRETLDAEQLDVLKGRFESDQKERLRRLDCELAARRLRLLSERAEAVRKAQVMRFRLARPTYGQHENILAQAQKTEQGVSGIDERTYRQMLLKAHSKTVFLEGKELTPEQIDDLDPAVGSTLGTLLSRSLAVDRARLPFTSSASDPS